MNQEAEVNSKAQTDVPVAVPAVIEVVQKVVEEATLVFKAVLTRAVQAGVPREPGQLHDLERHLHALVARYCVDPVVGALIQAAHFDAEVCERAMNVVNDYPDLTLQKSDETVRVRLLGGTVFTVITPYFLVRKPGPGRKGKKGKRGPEGNGLYPLLAVLGIHFRVSPAMLSEVARLVARGTVQEAVDSLRVRGVKLNHKVVTRWAQRLAERGLAHREWLARRGKSARPEESSVKGKRLVIGTDGGRLRTRINREGRRRRSGRHGFEGAWREPKVLVIYEIDEAGRKLHRGMLWYDATLADADQLFKILAATLISIGAAEAAEWIFVGDGADWIWNRIAGLVREVGYDPEKVTEVVDFYHAAEHLREVAAAVKGWDATQQRAWFLRVRKHLRQGSIDRVIEEIECLCIGRNAKKMRDFITYFDKHADRMDYKTFERRCIPIGSGAVESAVRRLVNLRFKGNGIFWRAGNAEGLLHLRAQLLAGRWDHFIRTALQPEPRWAARAKDEAPGELEAVA